MGRVRGARRCGCAGREGPECAAAGIATGAHAAGNTATGTPTTDDNPGAARYATAGGGAAGDPDPGAVRARGRFVLRGDGQAWELCEWVAAAKLWVAR